MPLKIGTFVWFVSFVVNSGSERAGNVHPCLRGVVPSGITSET